MIKTHTKEKKGEKVYKRRNQLNEVEGKIAIMNLQRHVKGKYTYRRQRGSNIKRLKLLATLVLWWIKKVYSVSFCPGRQSAPFSVFPKRKKTRSGT